LPTSLRGERLPAYLPALDGLRGIAILLVLIDHFTRLQPVTAVERLLSRGAAVGWVGVDLFFGLSGFLITGILLDAKGGDRFFRNFYLRRACRIFPLYYGFLLVVFLGLPHAGVLSSAESRDLLDSQGWYWSYLSNLMIARVGSWTPIPMETLHFWSLAVEEQFYLLWPLLVWAIPQRRLKLVCLGAVGGSLVVRLALRAAGEPGLVMYVLTPTHLDPLALGAWLAVAGREPGVMQRLSACARPVVLASALGVGAIMATAEGPVVNSIGMQSVGYPLLALLCVATLVTALTTPADSPVGRLWRNRPLRFLGRHSYALYVLHPMLLLFAVRWGYDVPDLAALLGSQLAGQACFATLLIAVSSGVAFVTWHLWEEPFLRLKAYFPMRGPSPLLLRPDPLRAGWRPASESPTGVSFP
jgi:peptidoglycan/LPS O-acetylase OafA/YrhL